MPFARRAGLRLHWEISGLERGPAILMIRGLSRSSRYWYDLRPLLEPRFRVLVMDNRGVGRSDAPGPGFTTADMADDVAAVLHQSGVHRAHVFGISLGGMIAQHVALRHPGRVDRLVLGATTMGGRGAERAPHAAILGLLSAGRGTVADQIRVSMPWVLDAEAVARRPAVVDEWIAIAEAEPRNRLSVLGQLLAAAVHDTSDHLHRVRTPTLVVTGNRDRLIPMANSRRIASAIPGSTLQLLEGAGHDFPTERPDDVAHMLSEFLLG
ncbi:MAG: alpha/beta hydrolase [Myxococcota bacterium]|nr:alpha/beta hydrolase [Myxococcota bacterium]